MLEKYISMPEKYYGRYVLCLFAWAGIVAFIWAMFMKGTFSDLSVLQLALMSFIPAIPLAYGYLYCIHRCHNCKSAWTRAETHTVDKKSYIKTDNGKAWRVTEYVQYYKCENCNDIYTIDKEKSDLLR